MAVHPPVDAAARTEAAAPPRAPLVRDHRCAVVVVHYRGFQDTSACIDSLLLHAPGTPIVVVDNDSPDRSGKALAAHFSSTPFVTCVDAGHNGGFGAGCNLGIERALAQFAELEHVLLLNPDARLRPGALLAMRACAAHHGRAGIVGCRIVEPNGDVWFANGRFPRFTLSRFHCAPPGGATEFEAEFVTGCCMLLDAGMLRRGLRFDESFFLYGEDADLCRRVQETGRTLWITQQATVEHGGGGSQPGPKVLGELSAERLFWLTRAKVLLARKHYGLLRRVAFWATALVGKPAAALARGHGLGWIRPYFAGLLAGLRSRPRSRPGAAVPAATAASSPARR